MKCPLPPYPHSLPLPNPLPLDPPPTEDKQDKEESATLLARDFALQLPEHCFLLWFAKETVTRSGNIQNVVSQLLCTCLCSMLVRRTHALFLPAYLTPVRCSLANFASPTGSPPMVLSESWACHFFSIWGLVGSCLKFVWFVPVSVPTRFFVHFESCPTEVQFTHPPPHIRDVTKQSAGNVCGERLKVS